MQKASNKQTYWQLFKTVRPLFASDIPWKVQQDSQYDDSAGIAIENTGDLIKACMREIPIHIPMEHFDTLDGCRFIADGLGPFLLALQELVHDKITEHVDTTDVSKR